MTFTTPIMNSDFEILVKDGTQLGHDRVLRQEKLHLGRRWRAKVR